MEKQKENIGKILKFPIYKTKLKKSGYKMPKIFKVLMIVNVLTIIVSLLFLFSMHNII